MKNQEKIKKLQSFKDENDLREFLIDLLKLDGFKKVRLTHQYGRTEKGKDIIGERENSYTGSEWYAFVVKKGQIKGNSREVEEIKAQIKQSFEYPYENPDGNNVRVNKVVVVANENITEPARTTIGSSSEIKQNANIIFWDNQELIEHIDKAYSDFWLPGESIIKIYSKNIKKELLNEYEIRGLSIERINDSKINKLLKVFVEPEIRESKIIFKKEGKGPATKKVENVQVSIREFIDKNDNFLVYGDPGCGKSRFLNRLMQSLMDKRQEDETSWLPVRLKLSLLKEFKFSIKDSIQDEVKRILGEEYERIDIENKKIVILIDSIDELLSEEVKALNENLLLYKDDSNIRFIISARSKETIESNGSGDSIRKVKIHNFNIRQIEEFVEKYFSGSNRGERFISVLKESNILSKLPTTPLTVTLISLLYDENDYEIPATVTDIYKDFSDILLGKLEIKNRQKLIELTIKKRIFSYIALSMLNGKNFEIRYDDFENIINPFLVSKGVEKQTPEDLKRIIKNSGLSYLDDNNNVGFKHLSFLEYFASIELYHYQRNQANKLISNFNDVNWQNSAIFYAGHSKDMPDFIYDLIEHAPQDNLRDWFLNTGGFGYLCQALYLTDIQDRQKLIDKSLELSILAYYKIKELSQNPDSYFYNMSLPIIASIIASWFNSNFKSITLIDCLKGSYDNIQKSEIGNPVKDNFETGFKLFMMASTLATKYLDDWSKMEDLLERPCFIKDPVLMITGDMFLELGETNKPKKISDYKKVLSKQIQHYRHIVTSIIKEPAYRFTEEYKREESK